MLEDEVIFVEISRRDLDMRRTFISFREEVLVGIREEVTGIEELWN
jgi:hypothetical protein